MLCESWEFRLEVLPSSRRTAQGLRERSFSWWPCAIPAFSTGNASSGAWDGTTGCSLQPTTRSFENVLGSLLGDRGPESSRVPFCFGEQNPVCVQTGRCGCPWWCWGCWHNNGQNSGSPRESDGGLRDGRPRLWRWQCGGGVAVSKELQPSLSLSLSSASAWPLPQPPRAAPGSHLAVTAPSRHCPLSGVRVTSQPFTGLGLGELRLIEMADQRGCVTCPRSRANQ